LSVKIVNPDNFDTQPSAVLFDLDNTLYSYEPAHNAGMLAVRTKAINKIGFGGKEFDNAFSKARSETKKQLGDLASSHSRLLYFQRTLEILGLRSQILLSLEFEQAYWGSFLAMAELRDGVIDFLSLLSRANIPKVLVTDLTAQIQFRKLVYLGLDQQFEYVVTSEESGRDKPHRAGFDLALNKLNISGDSDRSSKVWMIGDNVLSDIEGAKSSISATTIALKSELGDHGKNQSIDMTIDSFTDLERYFSSREWDRDSAK